MDYEHAIFNQAITAWIVSEGLPWTTVESPYFRKAIAYLKPEARVYGRKWVADEAKKLFIDQQTTVFKELEVR